MPDPLGKAVTTTTTMDANLNHCLATGKSLTGFQSIPLLSNNNHTNNNHTNDAMEDAKTRTEHSSTSQVDLAHQ